MIVFGVVALAGNGVSLLLLRRGQAESLNVRGAFLEVASDTFGAVAVIVTGIVIAATGFTLADPIASLAVALLILPRTWRLLRDAVDVLLEASPRGHRPDRGPHPHDRAGRRRGRARPARLDHHLRPARALRARGGGPGVLANGRSAAMLDALQDCLRGHFDVGHSTFQLEPAGHAEHEPSVCLTSERIAANQRRGIAAPGAPLER